MLVDKAYGMAEFMKHDLTNVNIRHALVEGKVHCLCANRYPPGISADPRPIPSAFDIGVEK